MFCVYCGKEKNEKFTKEHFLPQALGGNVEPINPFLLPVCQRCNSICGTYVDRPFVHSFFTQMEHAIAGRAYVDLSKKPALPLWHCGPENHLTAPDGRICEFAIGLTGDHVYHFHYPHDLSTRWDERDPGFVFLLVTVSNPAWHPTIIESVTKSFPKATFYLGNGPTPPVPGFADVPTQLEQLLDQIRSLDPWRTLNGSWDLSAGDRFLAKIALGMGALFLNADFPQSPEADVLRRFLWTISADDRKVIPFRGQRFAPSSEDPVDLSIHGGHVLVFKPVGSKLAMHVQIYKQRATVAVTTNPNHWANVIPAEGMVFIVIPGLKRVVGPVGLGEYIAWKDHDARHEKLDQLKDEMNRVAELPPYHLDSAPILPSKQENEEQ
jgi:hypothetical protein